MPSKTADIEDAIAFTLQQAARPLTLQDLETELYRGYPVLDGEDRRWIGVALMRLRLDGRIEYRDCDPQHNHDANCVIAHLPSTEPAS